jgi:glutathione S-transferase
MADELILHHYWTSPFSEKVRVAFAAKALAWRGVVQPVIMPKPELVDLTGGYRRIPVMQIGADIFIDSAAIIREIERRHPSPRFIHGSDWAINAWADRVLFQPTVAIIFGAIGEAIDPAFAKDREAMSGRPFDPAAMKAAEPMARAQIRAALAWLDEAIGAGVPFIGGHAPSLGDAAFWLNIWFYGAVLKDRLEHDLAHLPQAAAWRARMIGLGHGTQSEMTREESVEIAATSVPARPNFAHDPDDPSGLAPGREVVVAADDYGRDPVHGVLVAVDARQILIARQDPLLGDLNVHFPRSGYVVTGA